MLGAAQLGGDRAAAGMQAVRGLNHEDTLPLRSFLSACQHPGAAEKPFMIYQLTKRRVSQRKMLTAVPQRAHSGQEAERRVACQMSGVFTVTEEAGPEAGLCALPLWREPASRSISPPPFCPPLLLQSFPVGLQGPRSNRRVTCGHRSRPPALSRALAEAWVHLQSVEREDTLTGIKLSGAYDELGAGGEGAECWGPWRRESWA